MKRFIAFIRSKVFVLNLLVAIVIVALALGLTYKWLNAYTRHGSSLSVPDLRGMQLQKVEDFLAFKNLNYKVSDSTVFDLSRQPGTVIEQDPQPDEKVKEGRTIYLSVTRSTPPGVKIPDLEDNSLRQAEAILKSYGLVRGQLIYKPDLAKNAVLEMQINGKVVKKGEEVSKGTAIDLVLGDGFGNVKVMVPLLFNLTLDEATFVINASSLNIGALIFDASVRDSSLAKVYKQYPSYDPVSTMSEGESIDLFLTQSESIMTLHEPGQTIDEDDEE